MWKAMVNTAKPNPIQKKLNQETSCRYSGSRNRYGIPRTTPNCWSTNPNKTNQTNSKVRFFLRWRMKSWIGKLRTKFCHMVSWFKKMRSTYRYSVLGGKKGVKVPRIQIKKFFLQVQLNYFLASLPFHFVSFFNYLKTLIFTREFSFWDTLKYFSKFPQHFARDTVDSSL